MTLARALLITCAITCEAIRLNYEPLEITERRLKLDSKENLIPWRCSFGQSCADYNPYTDLKCSKTELARIRVESKKEKGLIVAGQGGSGTRVAQQIAQVVGTYNWGDVDTVTKDSWAVRWGGAQVNHSQVFAAVGKVDYQPASDLSAKLLVEVEDNVCKTLMIADRMAHREQTYHPWALKEPNLRIMLPVFKEVVDFKFVHVTRDVRCLAKKENGASNGDEIKLASERDEFVNYANQKLADHSIQMSKFDTTQGTLFNPIKLKQALAAKDWTPEEQKWIKFAHVWAAVETKLHEWWTKERPSDYYLLAEHTIPQEDDKILGYEKSKKLAAFLGDNSPTQSTLAKMSMVYKETAPKCDDDHWAMMQKIIMAKENQDVKEALESLGYYI